MHILITGGAGFIGCNLSKKLIQKGYSVIILDSISKQIHDKGLESFLVKLLPKEAKLVVGDVCNREDWLKVINKVDVIVHLAAETGTGQSMYDIDHYCKVNIGGTSMMLDVLSKEKNQVKKIIVASSRAIYGEGKYINSLNEIKYPIARCEEDMLQGNFEPTCSFTREKLKMQLTDEESKIHPTSVYGISKQFQEQLVLNVCKSLKIDAISFRYQNVYGIGQSLTNPYTGILSIFSTLLLNNQPVNIFEDGLESRDFVNIEDVVNATVLGIQFNQKINDYFNIGTSKATSVLEVVNLLKSNYGSKSNINISGNFRNGDIRHNAANIEKAQKILGFQPSVSFADGLNQFCKWVQSNKPDKSDAYESSINELKEKGLFK